MASLFRFKLPLIPPGFSAQCHHWKPLANERYSVCPSLPRRFVVSASLTDEDISSMAKFHKKKRFPVLVWRHPLNKSALLRGALTKAPRYFFWIYCHTQSESKGNNNKYLFSGSPNNRLVIDETFCENMAHNSPHQKFIIVTEKEPHNMVTDVLNRASARHQGYYYPNVKFVLVDSTFTFSPQVHREKFENFLLTCSKFVSALQLKREKKKKLELKFGPN